MNRAAIQDHFYVRGFRALRRSWLSCAAWYLASVLLLVAPTRADAQTGGFTLTTTPPPAAKQFGDINVKADALSSGGSMHGYLEYRVSLTNLSPTRSHQVTVSLPATSFSRRGHIIREIKRTVEVAASTTAVVSLFQPPWPLSGNDLEIIIDGQSQAEALPLNLSQAGGMGWNPTDETIHLLVSQSASKKRFLDQGEFAFTDSASRKQVIYPSSDWPVQEWSTNWLGFSRYDGVVVTSEDLHSMPAAVQSALWHYLECGGSLMVLGTWPVPSQWQGWREEITDGNQEEEPSSVAAAKKKPRARGPRLPVYHVGFGEMIVTGEIDATQVGWAHWQAIRLVWTRSRTPWARGFARSDANLKFPVVERLNTPVRGLFVLMLVFAITIGPANLVLLARKRKKLWMLWTVPAISLATCLAVSGYALWAEGISAYTRTETLTILDEQSHQATTIGWLAFYSPLTPGEGLHFSYETELTAPQPPYWIGQGSSLRSVDWTQDQHLATGWIAARAPAHFTVRKSEVRRERLSLRREANGSFTAVNGLGADIRQLWWADQDGRMHTADKIAAGASAQLQPLGQVQRGLGGMRMTFSQDWLEGFESLRKNPDAFLRPGCYLAVLEASPFLEEGLRSARTKKSLAMVYGIKQESPDQYRER